MRNRGILLPLVQRPGSSGTPARPSTRVYQSFACAALTLFAAVPAGARAQASVEGLIAEGRSLLEQGKPRTAQERFDRAAVLDGATPRTRVWVVRGWIGRGEVDEALTATDELKKAGAPAADLDYLYGLGFHAAALAEVATGGGTYTQSRFEDSARFLGAATAADGARYSDAFLPLAEAAWYARDLDAAHAAALRAVELRPDDGDAHFLRGRIAFSRYSAARAADGEVASEAVEAHWREALAAFDEAVRAYGNPRKTEIQWRLAECHLQIGHLHLWKGDVEAAAPAYGAAMIWEPRAVDFTQVHGSIGSEELAALLAEARARFPKRHADDHPGAALLAWWDGYVNYDLWNLPEAEAAFHQAIAGNPDYINAWYYVFRAAYGQRKYGEALVALRANWRQDPISLVAALGTEREKNLAILEYLIGWLLEPEKLLEGEPYREAAVVAEIQTRVVPEEPRYWNNLGLFLRDHGERHEQSLAEPDPELLREIYEQAYAAYIRALDLAPGHPAYLNDTAVLLHYYLRRDWDESQRLYELAIARADEELARDDLSSDLREWYRTARHDAMGNLERLERMRTDRPGKAERAPGGQGAGN